SDTANKQGVPAVQARSFLTRGTTSALALLLIGSAVSNPAASQEARGVRRPTLSVPNPKAPPQIDGLLNDDCWNAVPPVTLGYSIGTWWDQPSQKTEARVLADRKNIYFGVRCFEAEPGRIIARGMPKSGMVLGADAVEFFLDPGCKQKR